MKIKDCVCHETSSRNCPYHQSLRNSERTITCHKENCKREATLDECEIKMGGLLCPRCRTILVWPHDPVYQEEAARRKKLQEDTK